MPRSYRSLSILLHRAGCANRPFYQLVVSNMAGRKWEGRVLEQIGTFDPVPNANNEKLVAVNLERLKYWVSKNASIETPAAELLGLGGMLPIHPKTIQTARENRRKALEEAQESTRETEKVAL